MQLIYCNSAINDKVFKYKRALLLIGARLDDECFEVLSPPLGGSLLGCPCIPEEFFLDWIGFDREAKRHFLTAFSDKPGLFCGILHLRRSYESQSQSYINRSGQMDVNWSRR